jgi:hypothetical protein
MRFKEDYINGQVINEGQRTSSKGRYLLITILKNMGLNNFLN